MISTDFLALAQAAGCIRIGCLRSEDLSSDHLRALLTDWQKNGNAGALAYVDSKTDILTRPFDERPWAKCALVVSFAPVPDVNSKLRLLPTASAGSFHAMLAPYALNEDYHITGKRILAHVVDVLMEHAGAETRFECCVDSSPVMEKQFALLAGIGIQGDNSLIRDDANGCRLHLGIIFTSLDLETFRHKVALPPCSDCLKCQNACPNRVFGNGNFQVTRCRAWIASEFRRPLSTAQIRLLGNTLFGCGLCTLACPSEIPMPRPFAIDAMKLMKMPTVELTAIIKDSILERTGVTVLKRNAAAIIANSVSASEWDAIKPHLLQCSNSPTVRTTIEQFQPLETNA